MPSSHSHFLLFSLLDMGTSLSFPFPFPVKLSVEYYARAVRIVVSHPTYLVVQWPPFVHLCQEVLEVLQGLEALVAQEAQGAQPCLKVQ